MGIIWINEHEYIDLGDRQKISYLTEIASRKNFFGFESLGMYLPDPDPILRAKGQDITIYKNLMIDSHVGGCAESRKAGVTSCEWEIKPGGPSRKDKKAAEFTNEVFDALNVQNIMNQALDAPYYGMTPIEVMWDRTESNIFIKDLVPKPPEWFVFSEENELHFLSKDHPLNGMPLPEKKFILVRHKSTYQNPYGERIMARCFWPATFKKGGFKFWVLFTEKYGMPWVIGKHPRGANTDEKSALLAALNSMVQDAVAVMAEDSNVEIKEGQKTSSAEIYDKLIIRCNLEISKSILGQSMTTEEAATGPYAPVKAKLVVREDIVNSDKKLVAAAFNQAIRWLTDYNFTDVACPEFAFFEEEDIKEGRAKRDTELTNQGVQFSKKYYMETYNLSEDDLEIGMPIAGEKEHTQRTSLDHYVNPLFSDPMTKSRNDGIAVPDDQKSIDNLVLAAQQKIGQAAVKKMLKPLMNFIKGASSFEELEKGLYELYPEMDDSEIEEILSQALFMADMWGRLQ